MSETESLGVRVLFFILQLKLCLYTTVHLLLDEFTNFAQVILKYTIIVSHNMP